MALDRGFTGMETAARDPFVSIDSNLYVCDGTARSGEWYITFNVVAAAINSGKAAGNTLTAGQAIADSNAATGRIRVWFRFRSMPSGATDIRVFGFGAGAAPSNGAGLLVKNNGAIAAAASTTIGVYTGAGVLTSGLWYRAELVSTIANPPVGNNTVDVSVSVYNEAGTLLATVTASGTSAGTPSFAPFNIGHSDANSSTYQTDFDDLIWVVEDNGPATLPVATRITRVDATAQGASAAWAGDFHTTIDVPRETAVTDEQSVTTNGATTTFAHATAAALGLLGIEALRLTAALKASGGAGNDALLINGVEFAVATPTAYPTQGLVAQDWNPYTALQFNAMEFGARNKRGVAMQLGQLCLEVLHAGTDPFKTAIAGVESWKHKVIRYTGDGGYQTVTGVGFYSQVILIKKTTGVGDAGHLKLACFGGSLSKPLDLAAFSVRAVMKVTSDGFLVGPDADVNAAGVEYQAICIQDGGGHASGYFMHSGVFIGNGLDDRDVLVATAWQPTFVATGIGTSLRTRSTDFVGDSSITWSAAATVLDQIQAFNANGFQVGLTLNANTVQHAYFAIRGSAVLDAFFKFGSFLGGGPAQTVSGLGFLPEFVAVKRIAAADAMWRGRNLAAHNAANCGVWSSTATINTGITALNAGGFDLGASGAQSGQTTHWFAFILDAAIPVATDLPPYWENPDVYGGVPVQRCLIMVPSLGTNFSREKTVTMRSGTPLANYPASNLTDDTVQTALRIAETSIDFYVDLGSAKTPDGVAILNHNIDPGLIVQIYFSDLTDFSISEQIAVTVVRPNLWVDLRNFPVTRRYVRVRTGLGVVNSKTISISQVVVASMRELKGVIVAESLEQSQKFWTAREFTEEMLPYRMTSGVFTRALDLQFELDTTSRDTLHQVFEDAGMTGYRVLFIPNSRRNDAYWIDWPDKRSTNYPESDRVTTMRLTLTEETPGVVN